MKRLVYIFNWFYLVSLSLWVGGMFLLGILVEIFVRVKVEDKALASSVMNGIMDAFNTHIIYTCIVLIVLAELVKFLVSKNDKAGYVPQVVTKRRYSREVVLTIMVVLALYIGSVLRPQMHELDARKKVNPENIKLSRQFDSYHSRLVWIYTVNMILGLGLFYIHGKEMTRFKGDLTGKGTEGKS